MASSHTTFSWHLYKTFTRTEDMFSVWKLHIGRWRETELSFAALVFGAFTSLVLSKCIGNAFLSLCSSSDQYLSCHINWPLVSDHYSAFCVFAPLLCAFLFTFSISRLSSSSLRSLTPLSAFSSLSVPLPSVLLWGDPGSEAAGPRLCVSLCENWVSVLVCSSRAQRSTGSSQP